MRSARALPGCLARCPVGSPSALRGVFSPDSPGPPRCGVSPFSHRPNSVQDHPALGAAQGHPSLPPSAPPPATPRAELGSGVSRAAISAELAAESQDGTRGPVRGSRGPCPGSRCTHSLRSGLPWMGPVRKIQLGRRRSSSLPAPSRAVRRAFARSGHLGSHFMPV